MERNLYLHKIGFGLWRPNRAQIIYVHTKRRANGFFFVFFGWVSVYVGDRTLELLGHKETGYHQARRPGGEGKRVLKLTC